ESSETTELHQKRLARERQASLRKRKNINDKNCLPETQLLTRQEESESPKICQKRLAKERQANLKKK
ncbi:3972_t:CDS:1, partial [Funneliformis caledonium]